MCVVTFDLSKSVVVTRHRLHFVPHQARGDPELGVIGLFRHISISSISLSFSIDCSLVCVCSSGVKVLMVQVCMNCFQGLVSERKRRMQSTLSHSHEMTNNPMNFPIFLQKSRGPLTHSTPFQITKHRQKESHPWSLPLSLSQSEHTSTDVLGFLGLEEG